MIWGYPHDLGNLQNLQERTCGDPVKAGAPSWVLISKKTGWACPKDVQPKKATG